ncbi:MAG: ABC transporter ATP-binding protein [Dehalococcoidia bacterium]|nr:ABC transporter ATP-binding protein [Dehalococcoidia bacterium]
MSERSAEAPIVQLNDVVKTYDDGRVRALDSVSMSVARGEFVAVTGPSGCGKSTLLHLIAALDRPDSGVIRVNGRDLSTAGNDRFRRKEIGLVFQLHNLLTHLSAIENIEIPMFGTGLTYGEQRQRALELLEAVGLADKQKVQPPRLSGGERQRLAIARALANRPPIVLADEPTGSLDSASVDRILGLFRDLRAERGLTLVLVTHDAHVAAAADHVVAMRDGRIIGPGSAEASSASPEQMRGRG